jgi:hypothetical protein
MQILTTLTTDVERNLEMQLLIHDVETDFDEILSCGNFLIP